MYIEENYTEYDHSIGAHSKISGLKDFKETRRYWKLKENSLDRNGWRTCFGIGSVIRHIMCWRHWQWRITRMYV